MHPRPKSQARRSDRKTDGYHRSSPRDRRRNPATPRNSEDARGLCLAEPAAPYDDSSLRLVNGGARRRRGDGNLLGRPWWTSRRADCSTVGADYPLARADASPATRAPRIITRTAAAGSRHTDIASRK
jgi:hypothetical protein